MIKVLLVDDQALVRTGLRMVLEGREGIEVVGEAADGEEALRATRRVRPDIVLMDVRMRGVDGIEAARRIVSAGLGSRVVMLTTFDLDEYVYSAMAAGASGFLLKDATGDQLEASIRLVAAGQELLAPSLTRRLIARHARASERHQAALATLTSREADVLKCLARGLSNAEIADELHLGAATIKTHVARLLDKLGVRDRVQAVILAYEAGIVS